jgi:predicted secreted protein
MKKNLAFSALLTFPVLIVTLSMYAFGCKSNKPATGKRVVQTQLNEDGNPENSIYEVKAGDTVEVRLKKNPSYRLHYLLLNEKQLRHTRFLGERYISKQKGEIPMPGAGGIAVYSFRAVDKGSDTLRFGKQPVSNSHPRELAYNLDTLTVTHQFIIKSR